jgi:hypothetical protein
VFNPVFKIIFRNTYYLMAIKETIVSELKKGKLQQGEFPTNRYSKGFKRKQRQSGTALL